MKTRSTQQGDAVAAYASLEGAERAVTHLVSKGYDEHDVGIGPRDFEEVDPHPLRRLLRRWVPLGLVGGAGSVALVAIGIELGTDALRDVVLPAMAWGAIGGLVIGLIVTVFARRIERAESLLSQEVELEPTRFEVIADQNPDQVRNELARWWDPAAVPAGWDPGG